MIQASKFVKVFNLIAVFLPSWQTTSLEESKQIESRMKPNLIAIVGNIIDTDLIHWSYELWNFKVCDKSVFSLRAKVIAGTWRHSQDRTNDDSAIV